MLPDPFTTEDGDVVLRVGSDDVFRVHRLVLSLASPVFRDLFQTAQPDQPDAGQENLPPTIPITDSPESVDLLLRFIYPGVIPPVLVDLTALSALLTIADKYGIQTVFPIAKERLGDENVLKKDPFGVYTIARRWGFADEAKRAAQKVTLAKIAESPSSKNPQNVVGGDFFRLLWFMEKRGDEAKKKIRTYMVKWEDPDYGVLACNSHEEEEIRGYYEALAEKVVERFDVNPCLDTEEVVMALMDAPDPPHTGFCRDIDAHPAEADFIIRCPLRPSTIVVTLRGLAVALRSICEQYSNKAFDGGSPI